MLVARKDVSRIRHPSVIYFGRLGDMVTLTAVLSVLRERFGAPCHVMGAGSWNPAVYAGNPDVASLRSFDRHFPFLLSRQWAGAARALRAAHPAPIYICDILPRKVARTRPMSCRSCRRSRPPRPWMPCSCPPRTCGRSLRYASGRTARFPWTPGRRTLPQRSAFPSWFSMALNPRGGGCREAPAPPSWRSAARRTSAPSVARAQCRRCDRRPRSPAPSHPRSARRER